MAQEQPRSNLLMFFLIVTLFLLLYVPLRQRFFPEPEQADPVAKKKEETKKDVPAALLPPLPLPTAEANLLALGEESADSNFHLQVILDPLGAGVRKVLLNKFRPADDDSGKPGQGTGLALVPDEANQQTPSHLLYHYPTREAESPTALPMDTLGRRTWTVVRHDGKVIVTDTTEQGRTRQKVAFRTEIDGLTLTKTYSLVEGEYHVGLQVDVERASTPKDVRAKDREPIKFRYQLTGAKGLPVEGKWYTSIFRNAMIALEDDRGDVYRDLQELRQISIWGGGKHIDRQDKKFLRYAGIAVQYFASVIVVDENQDNQTFLSRARPTLETAVLKGRVKTTPVNLTDRLVLMSDDGKTSTTIYLPTRGRAAMRARLGSLAPNQMVAIAYHTLSYDDQLKECPKVALEIYSGGEAEATHALWEDDITVRVMTEPVTLAPGDRVSHRYLLYNGPVKPSLLYGLRGDKGVDPDVVDRYASTLKLNTLTDYQSPGFMGTFSSTIGWTYLVVKCTNLMHWVLGKMHLILPSYGLSIIFLTVLVRLMMFPLSRKQAIMGLKMASLQPELKKLAEKHKDDRAAYAQAQMALFRQHGVNPVGSCWVVLLQMPIFMGLYFALQESIQFRLAPFWPTWITNLAAPDMMFGWGRSIPLLSRDADYGGLLYLGPYFNLLPIIAVGLMVMQQKMLTPPPADKEQEMQHKMMRFMMIIFGLFFYKIAAGLCIYIITSTLWGFTERKLLPKAKPIGIDTDLDRKIAEAAAADRKSSDGSTAITAPSAVTAGAGKKAGRNKRKNERRTGKPEEITPASGLGRLRQRLSDWWSDVLEQARKK